jgi:hypothetical protein
MRPRRFGCTLGVDVEGQVWLRGARLLHRVTLPPLSDSLVSSKEPSRCPWLFWLLFFSFSWLLAGFFCLLTGWSPTPEDHLLPSLMSECPISWTRCCPRSGLFQLHIENFSCYWCYKLQNLPGIARWLPQDMCLM